MTSSIDAERIAHVLGDVCRSLQEQKDYLNQLDASVGDGDTGISVSAACNAVLSSLEDSRDGDIGKLLATTGMALSEAGATIGALLSIGFIGASRELNGKTAVDISDVARALTAAEEAIKKRGKADVGHKTMLDALVPARVALQNAIDSGVSSEMAGVSMLAAAEGGMLSTKEMKASFGRARWLGDRTIGHQDPGATLVYLVIKAAIAAPTQA